jgi:hypothetical protein
MAIPHPHPHTISRTGAPNARRWGAHRRAAAAQRCRGRVRPAAKGPPHQQRQQQQRRQQPPRRLRWWGNKEDDDNEAEGPAVGEWQQQVCVYRRPGSMLCWIEEGKLIVRRVVGV